MATPGKHTLADALHGTSTRTDDGSVEIAPDRRDHSKPPVLGAALDVELRTLAAHVRRNLAIYVAASTAAQRDTALDAIDTRAEVAFRHVPDTESAAFRVELDRELGPACLDELCDAVAATDGRGARAIALLGHALVEKQQGAKDFGKHDLIDPNDPRLDPWRGPTVTDPVEGRAFATATIGGSQNLADMQRELGELQAIAAVPHPDIELVEIPIDRDRTAMVAARDLPELVALASQRVTALRVVLAPTTAGLARMVGTQGEAQIRELFVRYQTVGATRRWRFDEDVSTLEALLPRLHGGLPATTLESLRQLGARMRATAFELAEAEQGAYQEANPNVVPFAEDPMSGLRAIEGGVFGAVFYISAHLNGYSPADCDRWAEVGEQVDEMLKCGDTETSESDRMGPGEGRRSAEEHTEAEPTSTSAAGPPPPEPPLAMNDYDRMMAAQPPELAPETAQPPSERARPEPETAQQRSQRYRQTSIAHAQRPPGARR